MASRMSTRTNKQNRFKSHVFRGFTKKDFLSLGDEKFTVLDLLDEEERKRLLRDVKIVSVKSNRNKIDHDFEYVRYSDEDNQESGEMNVLMKRLRMTLSSPKRSEDEDEQQSGKEEITTNDETVAFPNVIDDNFPLVPMDPSEVTKFLQNKPPPKPFVRTDMLKDNTVQKSFDIILLSEIFKSAQRDEIIFEPLSHDFHFKDMIVRSFSDCVKVAQRSTMCSFVNHCNIDFSEIKSHFEVDFLE